MDPAAINIKNAKTIMNVSIIVLVAAFVLIGFASAVVGKPSSVSNFLHYSIGFAIMIAAYLWCLSDSVAYKYPFGKYMIIWFVLFLPLGAAIYFYRSRGFQKGSKALLKAIGGVHCYLYFL